MNIKRLRLLSAFKNVFGNNNQDGKIILEYLFKQNNMMKSSFDKDPYITAFNEGKRKVILELIALANADMVHLVESTKKNRYEE